MAWIGGAGEKISLQHPVVTFGEVADGEPERIAVRPGGVRKEVWSHIVGEPGSRCDPDAPVELHPSFTFEIAGLCANVHVDAVDSSSPQCLMLDPCVVMDVNYQ